jgi:CSLREA domain-containing protein
MLDFTAATLSLRRFHFGTEEENLMIRFVASVSLAFALLCSANAIDAAVYTVTKTADTNDGVCDADCSLREAIGAANATADNDSITFALPFFSSPQTITLSGSELVVAANGSLSIFGPGANRLTISGNSASRILVSGANVVVNIHNLRFTGGNGVGATNTGRGGAIYNVGGTMVITNSILTGNTAANGGALNNAASASPSVPANLTLINCIISNNSSTSSGSAMQNFSTSFLHMRNTTVNNNTTSSTGIAGAFQANGTVTISNSTFSGNSAPSGTGGGLYYNGTSLIVTNSTFAFNSCAVGGGGFHRTGTGLTANFRNSIISNNSGAAGTLDAAGLISSQGNNIIQSVGTSTGWIMSDQQNVDPLIAPSLGFYGGLGMTHLPLAASPAINAGQNCVTDLSCSAANPPIAITTDERGAARPFGPTVDVGAVEASADYYATVPSATAGTPYNFTLVPANNAFTYSTTSGGFGGIALLSTTSTTLSGIAPVPGVFNALVQLMGSPGQASQNYRINVLQDASIVSVGGRVVTSTGEPVGKAYVSLVALNGQTYRAFTNPFGYFRIDGVPAGVTGSLVVNKKGYIWDPLQLTAVDVIDNLEIRALP